MRYESKITLNSIVFGHRAYICLIFIHVICLFQENSETGFPRHPPLNPDLAD